MILGYKPDAQTDRQTKRRNDFIWLYDSNSIYTKKKKIIDFRRI